MRKKEMNTAGILRLTLTFMIAFLCMCAACPAAFAEAEGSEQEPAVRTVMLYICASDLESRSGMATHNLKQILSAEFSHDDNVRFIVMTGGAKKWKTESKYLCDPYGIGIEMGDYYDPDTGTLKEGYAISRDYNQIWEAKGADAVNEKGKPDENAGKLWLLKGKGVTGDDVRAEDELMSDPETLKAFIDYCVVNYPAEKYDLILWDHGGGPAGGFGIDLHNKAEGEKTMQLYQIMDAVSDNLVTDSNGDGVQDGRFDFIDFDACLMSTVEIDLALADWMDHYIASAETEPGLGQNYTPWLNALGKDPDHDTYELGKLIVDSYIDFYENGDKDGKGKGEPATLSVVDTEELMSSGFVRAAGELAGELRRQAEARSGDAYLFYDELGAADGSIEYELEGTYDLGNFAGQLAVTRKEAREDLSPAENPYIGPAKAIQSVLDNEAVIYGKGTQNMREEAQFFIDKDGKLRYGDQTTSGMYIWFPPVTYPQDAVDYCHDIEAAIERLPASAAKDGRRDLLLQLRQVAADYGLILQTGRAAAILTAKGNTKIDYQTVRDDCWKKRKNKEGISEWTNVIQPLLAVKGGETGETVSWLDAVIRQQADEAVTAGETTAYTVSRKGDSKGLRVEFNGTNKRVVSGASLEISAELPSASAYVDSREYMDERDREVLLASPLGGFEAEESVDDLEFSDTGSAQRMLEDYLSWYNSGTSKWDFASVEDKWYAVRDEKGVFHAAKVDIEGDTISVPVEYEDADSGSKLDADLIFKRSGSRYKLSKLRLWVDRSWRTIPATELKEDMQGVMTVNPVELVQSFPVNVPLSGTVFDITTKNVGKIVLDYAPLSEISDITALNRSFVVKDIYDNSIDITEKATHPAGELISIENAAVKDEVYNGEALEPSFTYAGEPLEIGRDYTLYKLSDKNEFRDAGEYYVTLHGKGRFCGIETKIFRIKKAANTLKIKGKKAAVKYSKLKKKSQTLKISRVISFTDKGQGTKTYKLVSAKKGNKSFKKYFKVNTKTGKVAVKKGLRRGTYTIKAKIKASGNANHKASGWKTVTFRIQVR